MTRSQKIARVALIEARANRALTHATRLDVEAEFSMPTGTKFRGCTENLQAISESFRTSVKHDMAELWTLKLDLETETYVPPVRVLSPEAERAIRDSGGGRHHGFIFHTGARARIPA